MKQRILHASKQFIKFAIIGAFNTILGYGVYYALLTIGLHYLISLLVSFVVGVTFGFTLNKIWVFRSAQSSHRELPKYLTVYVSGLAINMVLLPVFVEAFHYDPRYAQLFFLFFMPAYTFVGLKFWSFA